VYTVEGVHAVFVCEDEGITCIPLEHLNPNLRGRLEGSNPDCLG